MCLVFECGKSDRVISLKEPIINHLHVATVIFPSISIITAISKTCPSNSAISTILPILSKLSQYASVSSAIPSIEYISTTIIVILYGS